jgi:polyisoprenoid-binding protein YceI
MRADTFPWFACSLRQTMRTRALILPLLLVATAATAAAPKTFDFRDPKTINSVVLVLDGPLEPVVATAAGVSGSIVFDPGDPKHASGKIVVDAATVQFPNPGFTASARGPDGFDAERFPTIEFAIQQVKSVRALSPTVYAASVAGDFTCHGVTKRITVDAEATFLAGKAMERSHSPGDLLVLRSTFKLRRRDFGIKPRMGDNLVAEVIEVRVAIAGTAAP